MEVEIWGLSPRLMDLSLPQVPLQLTPLLQLTRPPNSRHSRALRHPLSTCLAPQSAASATGAPANSGENQGSGMGSLPLALPLSTCAP